MHPFPTLCEGMLGNSLASLFFVYFFLHTMKMNSAHAVIIMCSREERKSYRLASTGWVNEVFLQCRMKSLTHISPRLYTNIMLDLLRTNCLPLWCLWRHDTPLTRVSVCMCVRAQQLACECSGVRVSECVLLVECGSCPHALYEQPTCPNSARVAEDVTPTKTADARSQHSLWSVIGGKSAVQGRVGAGRNYTESHLFRVKYNIFTVLTSVGSKFVLCPETTNHPQGAEEALSESTDIFWSYYFVFR